MRFSLFVQGAHSHPQSATPSVCAPAKPGTL
jgi:hypothetical protein